MTCIFRCRVDADPPATIEWKKGWKEIDASSEKRMFIDETTGMYAIRYTPMIH